MRRRKTHRFILGRWLCPLRFSSLIHLRLPAFTIVLDNSLGSAPLRSPKLLRELSIVYLDSQFRTDLVVLFTRSVVLVTSQVDRHGFFDKSQRAAPIHPHTPATKPVVPCSYFQPARYQRQVTRGKHLVASISHNLAHSESE